MNHLRPEALSALLDGVLQGAAREQAEHHLAECAECREALTALAKQDALMREALVHDPGEAYFDDFAARVEDRIRAAGLKGAQARLGHEGAWGWLSSPRRLAWAGAAIAVIGGAGVVMLTSRQEPSLLQNPKMVERSQAPLDAGAPEARQEGAKQDKAEEESVRPQKDAAASKTMAAPENAARLDLHPKDQDVAGGARAKASTTSRDALEAGNVEPELPRAGAREAFAPAAPTPQRAQAVRRSASGEDVPVKENRAGFAESPPATGSAGDLKLAKPSAAQPMERQPSASTAAPTTRALDRSNASFCGRVIDARQHAVAGATVAIADRGLVTTTGPDGRFCLDASAGLHELSVMAVGYAPTRLQVSVEGESSEALVTLRPAAVLDAQGTYSYLGKEAGAPAAGLVSGGRGDELQNDLQKPKSAVTNAALDRASAARRAADSLGTPAAFDAAATAWAKVVSLAAPGSPRIEALDQVAEARYRAWQLAPTASRMRAARVAIDAYLRAAPAGERKNRASTWRRELGR